jgi:hypothetical protein
MSDWKTEFKRALIDTIVANGTPIEGAYLTYISSKWREIKNEIAREGIDYASTTWEETRWWDGADTFNDGQERIGLNANVMLSNGIVQKIRFEGTVSELIFALINDVK